MPIYEYACPDCGHQGEHMQKLADSPLTDCPSCGKTNYVKKISAAGFALKGSGWYVTDFRNGSQKSSGEAASSKATSTSSETSGSPSESSAKSDTASSPATATPAPAAAPAPMSAPASTAG